jgi:hypothetical protein
LRIEIAKCFISISNARFPEPIIPILTLSIVKAAKPYKLNKSNKRENKNANQGPKKYLSENE